MKNCFKHHCRAKKEWELICNLTIAVYINDLLLLFCYLSYVTRLYCIYEYVYLNLNSIKKKKQ